MQRLNLDLILPDWRPASHPRAFAEWLSCTARLNINLLLRLLVVTTVILTSALFTNRIAIGNRIPTLLFLVYIGAVASIILIRSPYLGLIGIIVAGLVIPFSLGTNSQTGINAAVLAVGALIGLWILEMIVQNRQIVLIPSAPVVPALILVLVSILSFGFGQLPWLSAQPASQRAQLAGLAIFILSIGAFLLVANRIRAQRELEWMVWVFIGIGAIEIVRRVFQSQNIYLPNIIIAGATGSLFWNWLIALAFSLAAFNKQYPKFLRLLLAMLVVATFYVSFFEGREWVSGWLPSLFAILVILIAKNPRLGVLIFGGSIAVIAFNILAITGLTAGGNNEYSLFTRLEAWKVLLEIIKLNPVFGSGPANYYWYSSLFPISGYYVPFNSHNNYVDIVAQIGLVGLSCFMWFALKVWQLGWRLRIEASEGFSRAYTYAALGGLAGTLVSGMLGDWILPFIYNVGLEGFRSSVLAWLFLGGLAAIEKLSRQAEPSPEQDQNPRKRGM